MKTIPLYHIEGVEMLGIGVAAPDKPADVPEDQARLLLRDHPQTWSREPFIEVKAASLEAEEVQDGE